MYQSWESHLGNLIPEFFKVTDRTWLRRRKTALSQTVFQTIYWDLSTYQVPGAISASADIKKNKTKSLKKPRLIAASWQQLLNEHPLRATHLPSISDTLFPLILLTTLWGKCYCHFRNKQTKVKQHKISHSAYDRTRVQSRSILKIWSFPRISY